VVTGKAITKGIDEKLVQRWW